jgi:hypothetical protein
MKKLIRWIKDKEWIKEKNKEKINNIYINYMNEDILRFMMIIIIILSIVLIIMGKYDFILMFLIFVSIITLLILYKPNNIK